ncbi:MAG: hypothetical protein M5U16_15210 [Hyphomicrobium sp.]|nr:hypothetical protein [Hyphomicrobium sp.]
MLAPRIYLQPSEVEAKLSEFRTTAANLLIVTDKVVGARADAVEDDPLGTAGQFAYIFGTRNLRGLLKRSGYERYREENVESVRDPATGRQIVYQSVDVAGTERSPLAIRGKGSGARRLIDAGQGSLFPEDELPERFPDVAVDGGTVWYFCVSVETVISGELHVGAELSLPLPLRGITSLGS